ncbi:DUF421 domain-containing protein [Dyadobacter arcticus]|uniref:Uncharacterized membrane protein YcaP (DUF421 family) n=1 Tax=Dyadobacter arcticus TaxID=1078754 RepID=A0ABX0UJF5_9BACT|nr:YetF domain-containing protein [Dyadobacter arcticus]NIJ53138.1 uncharacterized membrane protein YcaP (DUF421 family) [Dyadobacter arcticus]
MEKILHIDWHTLWVPQVSPLEIIIRGTLTYWSIFLLLRFFRRGTGQFSVSDILLIILIGDAAQNAMAGDYQSITEGVILVGTLVFWDLAIDWMGFKSKRFNLFAQPEPKLLIKDGVFQHINMRKEFISEDDLHGYLREKGVGDLKNVAACYLEGSGNLSVLEKK